MRAAVQQQARQSSVTTGTSSTQAANKVMIGWRRSQLIITNTSATAVVTIAFGTAAAVQGAGIRIPPNGSYLESTDGSFECWQDEVQVVSDAAGTVAVVERMVMT